MGSRSLASALAVAAVLSLATAGSALAQAPTYANALVRADGAFLGAVTLAQTSSGVRVGAVLTGLPPGWHGFHVHTTGSCVGPTFTSAGGHYNPAGTSHPNHAGDMPLLYAGRDGRAVAVFTTDRFTVAQLFDADGSAIIIHASSDNHANIPTDRYDPDPDATTLATGDAGGRIGCGVLAGATPPGPPLFPPPTLPTARAELITSTGAPAGYALLRTSGDTVRLTGEVRGVTGGFHGFHVHTTGSCEPPSFTSAGEHFNPTGATHPSHAGDLPVVFVRTGGRATFDLLTDRFTIAQLLDADGSAIVVHASPNNYANIPTDRYNPDPDATTLATGDSGARVVCGVVRALARCQLTLQPRRIRAGERTRIRAVVRTSGAAAADVRVRFGGPGIARSATANASGVATTAVRPRRAGLLRATVEAGLTTLGCSAARRILPARGGFAPGGAGGPGLTGRPI